MPFGFHALAGAWLFALLGPLVVFYFLKLKRPRQTISSLVLWRQVINDSRVNSPFQRFKRNLLLLLQILLLVLVVLAAMQPFRRARGQRLERIPVLIDCSASMAALDREGGVSRLDVAKKRARSLIDGLLPDQELCLISFSDTARKRTDFTNNKRVLRDTLDMLAIEDLPGNVEDALRLAQGLSRTASFDEVLLLSDGNFPRRAHFELSFTLGFQRLEPAGANLGITALTARRQGTASWDIFVQIEGSAHADLTGSLELTQDGDIAATQAFTLGSGEAERMIFRIRGSRATVIRARLIPGGFDSLASDNAASITLPALRNMWVYCPQSLVAYRHALAATPGIRVLVEPEAAQFDFLISDRAEDLTLKAGAALYVGVIPGDLQGLLQVAEGGSAVVDWRRNAALFQHVELNDLVLLDEPQMTAGVREEDIENLGYEVIAWGGKGPLILRKGERDRLDYFMLFDSSRSTLPYRVGFPVLVANLARLAARQAGLASAAAPRTGVLPAMVLAKEREYDVEGPGGIALRGRSDAQGRLAGVQAMRTGRYRVMDGGVERAAVEVALLAPSETGLAGVSEIIFDEDMAVGEASGPLRADRSLWMALALIAFLVLLVEWWYFNRRPLPSAAGTVEAARGAGL